MRMAVLSVFCALSALAVTGPAQPADSAQQRRGDQQEAFEARRNGRILPLRDIERRIVPAMKDSHYLGFVFDSAIAKYGRASCRERMCLSLYILVGAVALQKTK